MNTDNVFKNSGYIISNPNYNPKTKKVGVNLLPFMLLE